MRRGLARVAAADAPGTRRRAPRVDARRARRSSTAAVAPRTGSAGGSGSPAAERQRIGHLALDRGQPRLLAVQPRDRAEQAARVRMLRLGEERLDRGASRRCVPRTSRPRRCAISATTPRSCVMRMIAMPVSSRSIAQQLEDLRLDGDVERGGRLVGDEQLRLAGQRHRDHHALAHAARELVRIARRRAARARGCARARASRCACAAARRRGRWRGARRMPSTIWSPIVKTGLSEVIGSWKIIAMRSPRTRAHARGRELQQVLALEAGSRRAAMRPGGGDEPHDRERRDALAAARFADEAQRAPGLEREAHAVDGVEGARVGGEGRPQPADLEQGAHARPWKRAMRASISARSVMPAGSSWRGRQARKGWYRSRLFAWSRRSSTRGSSWSSTRRSRNG